MRWWAVGSSAGKLDQRLRAARLLPRVARDLRGLLVAGVVVQVAGEGHRQPQPVPVDDLLLEVGEVLEGAGIDEEAGVRAAARRLGVGVARRAVDPARLRRDQDEAGLGGTGLGGLRLHTPGDRLEVVDLRLVDVRFELHVGAPQPPVVGELDGEVAAALEGLPAADPAALAEQAGEAGQAVVPVVVARDRQDLRRLLGGVGEGGAVGPLHPVVVLAARRGGVDLVAAHEQDPGAGAEDRFPRADLVAAQAEPLARQQPGHGVGGVEAVAEVGDVVDPEAPGGWSSRGRTALPAPSSAAPPGPRACRRRPRTRRR